MLHSRMLRYLDEVVRAGSIRRAAERLNVSSSSINRQILALEEELGVPIFHRLPNGMRLTQTGELLIAHVRATLREHEKLQTQIDQIRGISGGEVRLASMGGLMGGVLPDVIRAFNRSHPRVTVTVRAMLAAEIAAALTAGEADLGLGYNLPDAPGVKVTGRFATRLGTVVARSHPLAAKGTVWLEDLMAYPAVLGDPSMTIYQLMVDAFRGAGLEFRPAFLANSNDFMREMVLDGETITFLSRIDVPETDQPSPLTYLPIRDKTLKSQTLILARREKGPVDAAVSVLEGEIGASLDRLSPARQ
ncbi:LysR family transcriptional regulator [Martelella sp. HB161492]|uniref:LysR family transcriptional regulator n=1 Tax=Martelella sp. HB161492 TaxID=2720726 RepID=UPI0015900CDC|nr:LysR family transcriptional regulator [Martelella sp. HB161492]